MIKVAVVENQEIFRKGMVTMLSGMTDVEVVNESKSGEEFLKNLPYLSLDIVFMEIKLCGNNGFEITKKAIETQPELKVIALTMQHEKNCLQEMLEAGAMGFLLKNINQSIIEKAIHSVMEGNRYFSGELVNLLAEKFLSNKSEAQKDPEKFSDKELQILMLICKGLTNTEIAEKLCISPRTVDGHRARMIERVGASNVVGLVVYAIKNNLIKI